MKRVKRSRGVRQYCRHGGPRGGQMHRDNVFAGQYCSGRTLFKFRGVKPVDENKKRTKIEANHG